MWIVFTIPPPPIIPPEDLQIPPPPIPEEWLIPDEIPPDEIPPDEITPFELIKNGEGKTSLRNVHSTVTSVKPCGIVHLQPFPI